MIKTTVIFYHDFKRLELINFKIHSLLELDFTTGINYIVGDKVLAKLLF